MKYLVFAAALATVALPALADNVTDAVQEGLSAYKANDLGKAAADWAHAARLVRQVKASKVTALLPKPLSGWTAEKPDTTGTGAAVFGGGINVSEHYFVENDVDNRTVTVTMIMDSPLLQSMIDIMGNAQFAAASGNKMTKVEGIPALMEGGGDDNTKLSLVINKNILVTIEGQPEKDVRAYAQAIDFKALGELK